MPDFEQPADPIPYVVLVVDESGSMSTSHATTISAINEYLLGLKSSLPADARVTLVKFDSDYAPRSGRGPVGQRIRITNLFDGVRLADVRELTRADYSPAGGTPLHDAIGHTIKRVDDLVKAAAGPVYFGVITDGEENSSVEYKLDAVQALVKDRMENHSWTFAFMGVDINAYAAGGSLGFRAMDTVSLSRDKIGATASVLGRSVGAKFGVFASAYASNGGDMAATRMSYDAFNATDATFKDEDRKDIETK